jgi:protein phosphatase
VTQPGAEANEPTQPIDTDPETQQLDAEQPVGQPVEQPSAPTGLQLDFSAISDVGRVRKDNQDSGYAGPWLLTVCDGVGGAARGDIASATAVSQIRELDHAPAEGDLAILDRVGAAMLDAHREIGRLVDDDPAINGTSTTATVALFDGQRVGVGHVGDSRAYLFRGGELSQLTTDHTFVQSLIDEGRITEEEARVHPHRNLILKALDGVHDVEPDLFVLELVPGDRLFLCSDGACGVLDDGRLADVLSMGTPDYAATELVRASLEAGSSDNVTCVVADVFDPEAPLEISGPTVPTEEAAEGVHVVPAEPMVVGAAAELKDLVPTGGGRGLFRGHRSGDTGELEPIRAEIPDDIPFAITTDPIDAEAARYAPLAPRRYAWLRWLFVAAIVVGLIWITLAAAWSWSQRQYYIGEQDGEVVIFRGVDASIPGIDLNEPVQESNMRLEDFADTDREAIEDGIDADDLDDARQKLEVLAEDRITPEQPSDEPTDEPSDEPSDPSTDPSPSSPGGTTTG